MRLKFTLIVFLILIAWKAFSQVSFPQVPNVVLNKDFILKPYIPHGDFATKNPNFLQDGSYRFSSNEYEQATINYGKGNFEFLYYASDQIVDGTYIHIGKNFNSSQFSATATVTSQTFKSRNLNSAIIKMNFEYTTAWAFAINHATAYGLSDAYIKNYNFENSSYKSVVQKLFADKQLTEAHIADMSTITNPEGKISYNTLIFEFTDVKCFAFFLPTTKPNFPDFLLCNLTVKNAEGDALNTYGQAVFFNIDTQASLGSVMNKFFLSLGYLSNRIYPIAFENLVNQFLNDEEVQKKIIAHNTKIEERIKLDTGYRHVEDLKIKYAALKAK